MNPGEAHNLPGERQKEIEMGKGNSGKGNNKPKATVERIDDDKETPDAQAEALMAGSVAEGAEKPKAKDSGKDFTSDEGFVLEATSLPMLSDDEQEVDAKTLKGVKLGRREAVLSHAVRGDEDSKYLVVVTTAGRKLARKL